MIYVPIGDPRVRKRIQRCLNKVEMEVDDNPSFDVVIDAIGNLPSNLFTKASKSRLIAAIDFYRQLKTRIGSELMYLVVNGSAAHGYAKETHDLDLFPFYFLS